MVEFEWASETWTALPDRALWWTRRQTLCIADLHLGKPAAYRHAGIPVPEHATTRDLERLDALIRKHHARRLIILGDLLHARTGRSEQTMSAFGQWRARHADLDILLIRGNHDASAGDPPADWNIRVEDEGFEDDGDPVRYAHDPEWVGGREGPPILCGHIHPAIALVGPAHSMKSACFWFSPRTGVLPAFGSFTGSRVVYPAPHDRILVVHDDQVVDVSVRHAAAPVRTQTNRRTIGTAPDSPRIG